MSIVAQERHFPFRIDQLLDSNMPEKYFEVIEGELVVMTPAGWRHNKVGYQFARLFEEFCKTRPDLEFAADNNGFVLQRDPDVLLSPDASLFRNRRRDPDKPWMEFCPEICVEVLSPSNNPGNVAYKRSKYFEAGAEQVWIAELDARKIEFHFRDERRLIVQGDETIQGEGIAAGMEINLRGIFAIRNE